jgi:hypothetical protein
MSPDLWDILYYTIIIMTLVKNVKEDLNLLSYCYHTSFYAYLNVSRLKPEELRHTQTKILTLFYIRA